MDSSGIGHTRHGTVPVTYHPNASFPPLGWVRNSLSKQSASSRVPIALRQSRLYCCVDECHHNPRSGYHSCCTSHVHKTPVSYLIRFRLVPAGHCGSGGSGTCMAEETELEE